MRKSLLVLSLFISGQQATAQDLDLFEQTESEQESRQDVEDQRITVNQNSQPAFTLRGTSRFGDQHHMVLVDRAGETVKLSWREGEQIQVPGYAGFQVVETAARQVSLRHPNNDTCFDAADLGVRCTDNNVAVLTLSTAQPLEANGTPATNTINGVPGMDPNSITVSSNGQEVFINGQGVFTNPFSGEAEQRQQLSEEEIIAREARQQARAARLQQFEAVRIPDENIPEGMRRVRTPFGDRLVPVRD